MARRFPFQANRITRGEISTALSSKLEDLQEIALRDILAVRNRLHLTHGLTMTQPANPHGSGGDLQTISAEVSISFERIADGDLSIIEESVGNIFDQLHGAQQTAMYKMISDTCDRTGNVVSAASEGFAEAFCQMLEKIQFSVSESGEIQLPQIHTGIDPSVLIKDLESKGTIFKERLENLKAKKSAEALAAEEVRKAKFMKASP